MVNQTGSLVFYYLLGSCGKFWLVALSVLFMLALPLLVLTHSYTYYTYVRDKPGRTSVQFLDIRLHRDHLLPPWRASGPSGPC